MMRSFFSWLNKRFGDRGTKSKLVVVKREATRFRLEDWKTNASLVSMARKCLDNNDFRIMLDVIRNENPLHNVTFDITIEDRAILHARCEGYMLALNNIESLGVYADKRVTLGSGTFGATPSPKFTEEEQE